MVGFFSGLLLASGIVCAVIGIVVRRFWPNKQGWVEFWILSFGVPEWLAFMIYGAIWIALGIALTWIGLIGGAPWL